MVDVTLSCKDGSIRAHKMVLSACSSYFKNIFSKFTNPYQYPVVIMKDVPFADLRAIVEFIYRGEVFVPQEQLSSVLKSAESLKVKGLSDVNVNKTQLVPRQQQQQHISDANVPLQHISSAIHTQPEFAANQPHTFILTKQG